MRDELDVVTASIQHLLDQGVDHVLVADHQSTDGTREQLQDLAASDARVHVALDGEAGHFQKEKITRLARAAWRHGAAWVLPFDADEFWYADGVPVAEYLAGLPVEVGVVTAATTHMVPLSAEPDPRGRTYLMDAAPGAAKVAFRSHPLVRVGPGNHGAGRVGTTVGGLHIAHVPYRTQQQVRRKFEQGARALDAAAATPDEGWHWRRGAELGTDELDVLWRRMVAGAAVHEVGWHAAGPMVRGTPLRWRIWDPEGELVASPADG